MFGGRHGRLERAGVDGAADLDLVGRLGGVRVEVQCAHQNVDGLGSGAQVDRLVRVPLFVQEVEGVGVPDGCAALVVDVDVLMRLLGHQTVEDLRGYGRPLLFTRTGRVPAGLLGQERMSLVERHAGRDRHRHGHLVDHGDAH